MNEMINSLDDNLGDSLGKSLDIRFKQISVHQVPMDLLLEADPCRICIEQYIDNSVCYVAERAEKIIAVCILNHLHEKQIELFNMAVEPKFQAQGIGSALLSYVIEAMRAKGVNRIVLGTGSFGYQLVFYQRLGFRVDGIIKNFFIEHYDMPIIEQGIQHKDMLRLALEL